MARSRIIHSDDLPWEEGGQGDLFAHRRRRLGRAADGQGLGCSLMELDPGKTAWPFHYHRANEEAIFVLAGEGTLRLGDQRVRVAAGDYVALPPGPEAAHQLTNTGAEVLRYLVVSTMVSPDVCVYPDARKVGVIDALDDGDGERRRVVTFPLDAEVGYWVGETTSLGGGSEAGASAGAGKVDPQARRQQVEQMVEADLEALRRKVGRDGEAPRAASSGSATASSSSSSSASPPGSTASTASAAGQATREPAPDSVDAELEALRRRVAKERQGGATASPGASAGPRATASPGASAGARATTSESRPHAPAPEAAPPSDGDDLDALKKLLDG